MLYYIVAHWLCFKYDISEGGEPLAQGAQRIVGAPSLEVFNASLDVALEDEN